MIKGITGGEFITVSGPSVEPYVNMSNPSAGMLRYNGNTQNVEVYDGTMWLLLASNYPSINLSQSAQDAIAWAMRKMTEEETVKRLAEKNLAINAAYNNLKKAEEQLKTTIHLSKDHDSQTAS